MTNRDRIEKANQLMSGGQAAERLFHSQNACEFYKQAARLYRDAARNLSSWCVVWAVLAILAAMTALLWSVFPPR